MEELRKVMARTAPANTATLGSYSEETFCRLKCKAYNEQQGKLHERDGYICAKCNNRGLISEPRQFNGHWTEMSVECDCMRIRRALRQLERSGLKSIIRDYTFKTFEAGTELQRDIKMAAMRFVQDDDHTWFFVGGASGAGKTHICTAIAGHYLRHSTKSVRYMLWRDDVGRIKGNVDPTERDKAIREFKTADVLYIDDLFKSGWSNDDGTQKPTAADIGVAFELINYRYNNPQLITIISSECMSTDILSIDEATGGRIVERTAPFGYGINIKPGPGKNHRLKGLIEL